MLINVFIGKCVLEIEFFVTDTLNMRIRMSFFYTLPALSYGSID